MRALVCDCCGKVAVLSDNPFKNHYKESNFHRVVDMCDENDIAELCDDCFKRLVHAAREGIGDSE